MMWTRRDALILSGVVAGTAGLAGRQAQAQQAHIAPKFPAHATTVKHDGKTEYAPGKPDVDYRPVITPNGVTLGHQIRDGVKIFHLIAEEVMHEFASGLKGKCWGYNGHVHGPTIEAVEGDKVRIYVTNKLKVPTSVHWHGMIIPSGMDGVGGLSQPLIQPGQTFVYEFPLIQHGTFMYHAHHDEMTQMAMGMLGLIVIHPRAPKTPPPDRDYAYLLSEWRLDPGTYTPNANEMNDFNLFTLNGRVYPGTDPIHAQLGEKIRIRIGNLSAMDHHPIHIHGHSMRVVETDGGEIPPGAQWPESSVLVPVGTTRTLEFVADNPGDWAMHCHMTHHVMNQMGHDIPNMLGVSPEEIDPLLADILPGYQTMGHDGMNSHMEHATMAALSKKILAMIWRWIIPK